MRKTLLVTMLLALVIVVVSATGCGSYFGSDSAEIVGSISSQQNIGIWVTGVGEVNVVPDIAMLSIGVQAQKNTVAEAQQAVVGTMDEVVAILASYSIDEEDIQTQQFSIQPVYNWNEKGQILVGYSVTNIVIVKIRNIDNTGSIIDNAVAATGDYIRVNSITFTVDEPEAYFEEARQEAMDKAEAKAKQLAELGGVNLGKPNYIYERSDNASPPVVYRDYVQEGSSSDIETSISPGEIEIQLTIEVHYGIK